MNRKKSGRTLVLAAAVAMLAMVLQGCGGDDGISRDRLDQEIAKAVEKARIEEEAAKTQSRFDEEVAKKAAEEKAAEEARKQQAAAEKAELAAEAARKQAEAAKAAAEKAVMEAEAAKAKTDKDRMAAEAAKAAAEKAVLEAEVNRKRAEDHATAEKLLVTMEATQGRLFPSAGNPAPLARTTDITGSSGLTLKSSTLTATVTGYTQATKPPREFTPPPPGLEVVWRPA